MVKKMLKKKFIASIITLSMLFVFGIQFANAGKKDDTLTVAVKWPVSNVDKYYNGKLTGIIIQRLFTDGLLYADPATMELKPALATSWKWINPQLVEFDLRKGIKFHDGSEMTADDVIYTFEYIANPANKSRASSMRKIDHVEKLGTYKIQIHLKEPYPLMLSWLASHSVFKKGCYDENGATSQNLNPNGTGPYRITKILDGKGFVFGKNNNYYKDSPKGQPSIGKIVVRIIPEENTQLAELLSGGVDWIFFTSSDTTESMLNNPKVTVQQTAGLRIRYLMMDAVSDTPFKKLKVRQALSHAINRDEIVKERVLPVSLLE